MTCTYSADYETDGCVSLISIKDALDMVTRRKARLHLATLDCV